MPLHLRALVVILVFAVAVFVLAKAPITAQACSEQDFIRRRNLWFALTLSVFLAHNFWIFILIASCVLAFAMRTETNRFALYLSVVLAVPHLSAQLPGLGVFDQLFTVSQLRMLALVVLLPTYLALRKRPGVEPFGQLLCDKLLLCSFGLQIALTLQHTTFTNLLREEFLYTFTDIFLVYYVASRSLRTLKAFRDALGAFVVSAMVFCLVLAFEFANRWLLYRGLDTALGATSHAGQNYLMRAGLLRAESTAGQSIIAGYTCSIAIGLYLYVGAFVPSRTWRVLGMLVLIAGIIGALARAPWVGAAITIAVFIVLGPTPVASLGKIALAGMLALPMLLMTESGEKVIDFLPWVGSVDAGSVDGRNVLATVVLQIINDYPVFGRFDFRSDPALEQLRGGDGLIDLVNTYLIIALGGGYVSLGLFVGIAAVAIVGILVSLHKVRVKGDERHVLGRSLLGTLLAIMFMIGATSPILSVYTLYWCIIGLAVGYSRLVARGEYPQETAVAEARRVVRAPMGRWAAAARK